MDSSNMPNVPTQGGAKWGSAHCRAFLYWAREPGGYLQRIGSHRRQGVSLALLMSCCVPGPRTNHSGDSYSQS